MSWSSAPKLRSRARMRSLSSVVTASVERVTVDRLGRQFRDIAADVVDHLPVALRLAVERRIALQQGAAVVVAHHLQRHAEFAAIGQDALVVVRQPRRAGIEIHVRAGVPGDALHAGGLADLVAAAQRPVAAAGACARLQDQRRIAGLAQFPGQHHAGDAGADDDDPAPRCRAAAAADRHRPRGSAAGPSPPWCGRPPRHRRACRPDGSGRGATAS